MSRRPPSQSPRHGARRSPAHGARGGAHGPGPTQRQLRVGEMLRHALADVLRENDVRDPELEGVSVTVTQVKPSPDMRHATVYCEPLGGKNAKAIVAALNRHKGFLRGEMGRRIAMKFTPDLRFVEDESFAEAEKIENILKSPEVQRDLASPSEEEGDTE
ncbi:MAG TPA: 30S ribosome-binding factor RbfA [Rhizomicrobium sp.]|nr:30S ribosome-binding factor RbfA [Rhizomicrobium sp.]